MNAATTVFVALLCSVFGPILFWYVWVKVFDWEIRVWYTKTVRARNQQKGEGLRDVELGEGIGSQAGGQTVEGEGGEGEGGEGEGGEGERGEGEAEGGTKPGSNREGGSKAGSRKSGGGASKSPGKSGSRSAVGKAESEAASRGRRRE